MMCRLKKLVKMIKWQRQIRAMISTQLSVLEDPALFALGGLTEEESEAVFGLVKRASTFSGPIIEFGTLFGLTTRLMALAKRPDQELLTLDNFCWNPFGLTPALHEQFTRRILQSELSDAQVKLVVEDSACFRKNYMGTCPSLVFLDADHSYAAVRDEIAWAKALGVPMICGHDYGNTRFGVTRAVDEAFPDGVQVTGMVWAWGMSP
jgi:hypothetical protein